MSSILYLSLACVIELMCTQQICLHRRRKRESKLTMPLNLCEIPARCCSFAGSKDSWDFGEGAGFYLNATEPGWEKWRMYEYITAELPQVLLQFSELDTEKVEGFVQPLEETPHKTGKQACKALRALQKNSMLDIDNPLSSI